MIVFGKVFPTPIMSALIVVVWLVVNQSVSVGHILIALLLAILVPQLTLPFRPERARIKSWATVFRLGLTVLYDIVQSNIQLARQVLGPESRLSPHYVWIPLDLRDEHGIITLAGIITMTPGTLSCDVSDDQRYLLVHAFSTADPEALARDIKQRYETPLREIFE